MDEQPDRREFLRRSGLTAAALGLTACGSRLAGVAGLATGGPFDEPTVLRSRNGRLDVRLVAAGQMVRTGGRGRFAYTYNGSTPGPTMRVRPGDVLGVTLVNRLGAPTNLHTHGLHVSPSGASDDVFRSVAAGASRRYEYEIPADHPSGLFWYHPHHHGMVAPQVFGGLAGAIVVEDAVDDSPTLRATNERLLVLADPPMTSSAAGLSASMAERMQGREGDVVLVNGRVVPRIRAHSGKLERWRVLNASSSRYQRLRVEGHVLHVIATDGGRIERPVARRTLLLAPGERTEVLIAASRPGTYAVRSEAYDRGRAMGGMMRRGGGTSRGRTIATLVVRSDGRTVAVPDVLAVPPPAAVGATVRRRTLTLDMAMGGMGGGMGGMRGGAMDGGFTIDGKTFDPSRTDVRAGLGTVEEWTVENPTSMDHPFHLHVWPFEVMAGGGGVVIPGGRKDTVNVPAGSSVRLRIPFTDFGGRTVYHCHILDHEDLGMMAVIDVT